MTLEEKISQNDYRSMLKRNHFCRDCLRQDAYTFAGRVYCAECTEKRKRQRHANTTEEARAKDAEKHKALRDIRREAHLCVRCGKQLEQSDSHVYCATCRMRARIATRKHRDKLSVNYPRGENGICWQCNKNKALSGKRLCEQCYRHMLEIRKNIPKQLNHPWKKIYIGGNHVQRASKGTA